METLAHSDQVNVSLLLGLLEKVPKTSNDLSRHARELVSLRILEFFLFQEASASPVSFDTTEKIELDPSANCEDVLNRILTKRLESPSPSCLQPADLEISKWDLLPFVTHKRSSLPKSTLQQLKDTILTGKYSFPASLKEKSGLPVGDQPEYGTQMDDVNRKRSADTNIVGGTTTDDQIFTNDGPVKKHKHDVTCSKQQDDHKSVSPGVDAQLGDPSAVSTQHNEGERCNFKEKIHVGSAVINGLPEKAYNGCTSPEEFAGDIEVSNQEKEQKHGDAIEDDIEEEEGGNDGDYCNLMQKNGEQKSHDDGVDLDKSDQNIPRNSPNGDEAGEGGDVSSDSDGFHEEENSIDTKKKIFLNSQCTYSQDSLATTDWTELNLCMKCSKDGKLLICSSDSCPLVIHESCLGSNASYDSSGNFYCPFCAYSQAISRYTDIKRKTSVARKDLAAFVCVGTQKKPKDHSHRSCRIKQNRRELERKTIRKPSLRFDGERTLRSGDPENRANIRSKKGVLCPPENDSSDRSQEISEEETEREDSGASKYFIRSRNQKLQHTSYIAIPCLRRNKLSWRKEEEETLQEGIRLFTNPNDRVMPWSKILEFGYGVFDKSRTAVDLKDKWRNMCRTTSKA